MNKPPIVARIPNLVIDLRSLGGAKLPDEAPANRAERRRQEKLAKKFEARQTFSRNEYMKAVEEAYQLGIQIALQAAKDVVGLGPRRLERILQQVEKVETAAFGQPVRTYQLNYIDEGKGKK
jgi:hypothetical protein